MSGMIFLLYLRESSFDFIQNSLMWVPCKLYGLANGLELLGLINSLMGHCLKTRTRYNGLIHAIELIIIVGSPCIDFEYFVYICEG